MNRLRVALILTGGLVMTYAALGTITDRDDKLAGHLGFLAGVLLAHDGVLLPAAIGVGVLINRRLPPLARTPVRVACLITASLLVVASPLVAGLGRRADNPSALPLPYGRNLAIVLALIWTAALTLAAIRGARLQRSRARQTHDHLKDSR